MAFSSLQEMIDLVETKQKPLWKIVQEDDANEREASLEDSFEQMAHLWNVMLHASRHYDENLTSKSGLVGGDGGKMKKFREAGRSERLCGYYLSRVMEEALKMGENNA